jgi:hypothetical protein
MDVVPMQQEISLNRDDPKDRNDTEHNNKPDLSVFHLDAFIRCIFPDMIKDHLSFVVN